MSRASSCAVLVVGLLSGLSMAAVPSTQVPYANGETLSASKLNADFANIEQRLAALESKAGTFAAASWHGQISSTVGVKMPISAYFDTLNELDYANQVYRAKGNGKYILTLNYSTSQIPTSCDGGIGTYQNGQPVGDHVTFRNDGTAFNRGGGHALLLELETGDTLHIAGYISCGPAHSFNVIVGVARLN